LLLGEFSIDYKLIFKGLYFLMPQNYKIKSTFRFEGSF
jgi:hypothetical protein